MKNVQHTTIGAFLRSAERALAERGGFSAVADVEARIVRLIFTTADGDANTVEDAPLPEGIAAEDVARRLLDGHAAVADPAALRFARETYFPIDFR